MKLKKLVALVAICLLLPTVAANAAPTSAEDARTAVMHWLEMDAKPLGAELGAAVGEVRTYDDGSGNPLYHVVYLVPAGFVIVAGDDLVEPIIGFLPKGTYDNSYENPLAALVGRDVPQRVFNARQEELDASLKGREFAPPANMTRSQQKWQLLTSLQPQDSASTGRASISDVRVPPLVQSKWNQGTEFGAACYNYYTPPYEAGNPSNYVCGCVATAASQLMRFHAYPTAGVGTGQFAYAVDKVLKQGNLRGGDDAGGAYSWDDMPLVPDASLTFAQRQAIGRLIWDVGISAGMSYESSGSGAELSDMAASLKNVFHYGSAAYGGSDEDNAPTIPKPALITMMNPNLDASFPVLLGIAQSDGSGGHAIVGDGYGYDLSTLYHHLNMGWGGAEDLWYNLPDVNTGMQGMNFQLVQDIVYNVFPSGSGEIISGRVTDAAGNLIGGASVTANISGGSSYTATTNSRGIYAIPGVPSSSTYTINATKQGYKFSSLSVSTLTSGSDAYVAGNVGGVDFVGSAQGRVVDSVLLLLGD